MITLARICLTPVIALLPFIQGYWPKVIAFVVFLIAAFSDLVDGYIARRYGTISELGMLLDPIADKLLLFATLVPIFWMTRHPVILARDKVDYAIPWWGSLPVWVALLLVGREVLITAFRFFAKRRGVVIAAGGHSEAGTSIGDSVMAFRLAKDGEGRSVAAGQAEIPGCRDSLSPCLYVRQWLRRTSWTDGGHARPAISGHNQ